MHKWIQKLMTENKERSFYRRADRLGIKIVPMRVVEKEDGGLCVLAYIDSKDYKQINL